MVHIYDRALVRFSSNVFWKFQTFQDEKLKRLVEVHGERWDFIANHFPDRADVQCQHRWHKVVNPELVKGECIVAASNVVM